MKIITEAAAPAAAAAVYASLMSSIC